MQYGFDVRYQPFAPCFRSIGAGEQLLEVVVVLRAICRLTELLLRELRRRFVGAVRDASGAYLLCSREQSAGCFQVEVHLNCGGKKSDTDVDVVGRRSK